jgi:hypothetical protein
MSKPSIDNPRKESRHNDHTGVPDEDFVYHRSICDGVQLFLSKNEE